MGSVVTVALRVTGLWLACATVGVHHAHALSCADIVKMSNSGDSEKSIVAALRADAASLSGSTVICAREMGLPPSIVSAIEAAIDAAKNAPAGIAVPTNCPEVVAALGTESVEVVVDTIKSGGLDYSEDVVVCAEEMGAPPAVVAAMRGATPSTAGDEGDWLQSMSAVESPVVEEDEPATATEAPREVTPPVVIRQVSPRFPEAARDVRGETVCMVFFTVDSRGRPLDIAVRGCPQMLHESVKEAGMKWRFKPAREDGTAVEGKLAVRVRFLR